MKTTIACAAILFGLLILAPASVFAEEDPVAGIPRPDKLEEAEEFAPPPGENAIELYRAAKDRLIRIKAESATGYSSANISIVNVSSNELELDLVGSWLRPRRRGYQRLGIAFVSGTNGNRVVRLKPRETTVVTVNSVCMDSRKSGPGRGQGYELATTAAPKKVEKILVFWSEHPRIRQSAVNSCVWRAIDTGKLHMPDPSNVLREVVDEEESQGLRSATRFDPAAECEWWIRFRKFLDDTYAAQTPEKARRIVSAKVEEIVKERLGGDYERFARYVIVDPLMKEENKHPTITAAAKRLEALDLALAIHFYKKACELAPRSAPDYQKVAVLIEQKMAVDAKHGAPDYSRSTEAALYRAFVLRFEPSKQNITNVRQILIQDRSTRDALYIRCAAILKQVNSLLGRKGAAAEERIDELTKEILHVLTSETDTDTGGDD